MKVIRTEYFHLRHTERSEAVLRFHAVRQYLVFLFILVSFVARGQPPVQENRDVPPVQPPKAMLEFSARPTVEEIFRVRVFEEPLVPIGGEPSVAENAQLAAALVGYAERRRPDDFASLTSFLGQHSQSPWRAALLTGLGLEYYNTAHYSLALEAWQTAWPLAKNATDARGKAIADRAAGELANLYARLGRMIELEALLNAVAGRVFLGAAMEMISGAREGLWSMQNRPDISFRCGPLALQSIQRSLNPPAAGSSEVFNSASTQKGMSLPQVAELSQKMGLNYQMAFREPSGSFVVPSVVHWQVDHYAALVRQEGEGFLLEDPTFGNTVWATRAALEAETSGYFLVPPGPLPAGWRPVATHEGETIWGKGAPANKDKRKVACKDLQSGGSNSCGPNNKCPAIGLAASSVHLMLVNLHLEDQPVGYAPPVGPDVSFTVRYNHRDAFQPANFTYSNFGPKWTCDWIAYLTDNPTSAFADVNYYLRGGGVRTFTGFIPATQSFAHEQYDQTLLTRTGPGSYQMLARDGSKLIFSQPDGSSGTSRKVFLTQILDSFGNAVTLTYDASLRLVAITDALGQVTTLTYGQTNDLYKITKVTDPFGRFATFAYDAANRLSRITDVLGMTSQFTYEGSSDFINSLITPYGTSLFIRGETNTTRWLETLYPDGSRDRVEFNQTTNLVAFSDPLAIVPQGIAYNNRYLHGRNTYYWSRNACATAYGDYSQARIYHWLHLTDINSAAGILESTKEPLERRVWYDYAGQSAAYVVGSTDLPQHVGRVIEDGSTQLYTYAYDAFGHLTNSVDPVGREFSYVYSTNGIDLLEVRQTRGANNDLLARTTYNAQHLPLNTTDAAGQITTNTYNARGQLLATTNPKGETTTYTYDANGYLVMVDGPLPGTNDAVTATYDALGRTRTKTDESGYTLTFEHDALDRLTRVTHPDGTFSQYIYNRLDPAIIRDRAGRQTLLEYDAMRQMTKRTDPLGRVTLFQWCSCGDLSSLTDPMGRTTTWHKDVQGRLTSKQYGDGSQVRYFYENSTSRLWQVIDEKQQVTQYTYNRDDTLNSIAYANARVPTQSVSYTYDPNFKRHLTMTDGTGTTVYSYNPIVPTPALGAAQLAAVDGPLANDTIRFGYDELGRRVSTAINGVVSLLTYDAAGRVVGETNALGAFSNAYDGSSSRLASRTFPNGQTEERSYQSIIQDRALQRISYQVGTTPVSVFLYTRDIPSDRITTWSQQAGVQSPLLHTFGYDAADQLLSATVADGSTLVNAYAYTYDPAGNRLIEMAVGTTNPATYNALNQISTTAGPGASRTNEWDAKDRLTAVNLGNQRTEFTYDGLSRLVSLRYLTNGSEVHLRRFVWCDNEICEERDAVGAVTKRFFKQGMKLETGSAAGNYYYTRDHLGSVREVTDSRGSVRARYTYDPYGRRTRLSGDVESDLGFAGMFMTIESGLSLTQYRAYDPELGRWLSRDPLRNPETQQGVNLYAYVGNNPANLVDPLGLCCEDLKQAGQARYAELTKRRTELLASMNNLCDLADNLNDPNFRARNGYSNGFWSFSVEICEQALAELRQFTSDANREIKEGFAAYQACLKKPCAPTTCPAWGGYEPGPRGKPTAFPPGVRTFYD